MNTAGSSRRNAFLAAGLVLLLVGANLYFRILYSGDALFRMGDDMVHFFYPAYVWAYGQMAEGTLPLWNPYQLCGLPALAGLQAGILYPPHLLFLVMEQGAAMQLLAFFHLGVAGLGAMSLARRLGLGWIPAVAAGVLFAARGPYPGYIHISNIFEVVAWLPFGCVAVVGLARGRTPGSIAGLGFCVGMSLLAGYPQATVYEAYAWGALLVLLLLVDRPPLRRALWALGGLFLGVALGAGLAAAMLLPASEMSLAGSRDLHALSPAEMFPTPDGLNVSPLTGLTRFMGAVGFSLLPASVLLGRRRALAAVFIFLGALTMLFSFGQRTPLFELYVALPLLDSFRLPSRIRFVSHFCFAFAAAIGLDAVIRSLASRAVASASPLAERLGKVALPLAAGGALAVVWVYATSRESFDAQAWLASAVAVVLLVAFAVLRRSGEPSGAGRRLGLGAGVALFAALLFEIVSSPPEEHRVLFARPEQTRVFHEPTPITRFLASRPERAWIYSPGMYPFFPLKLASAHRFRTIADYEPANLRRQAEYFRFLMQGSRGLERQRMPYPGNVTLALPLSDPAALAQRRRLLDLTAARYLLADNSLEGNERLKRYLAERGYRFLMKGRFGSLHENPNALPRAYVTYRVETAPPVAELLERMSRDGFDPRVRSYVEGSPDFEEAARPPRRGGEAQILTDEPNRVVVEARLAAPGMLVLADSHYPGWRATLEGEALEIHPANHLFRGVFLPAGTHRVVFEYRPRSFTVGASISGLSMLVCAGLALWDPLRARRAAASAPKGIP